MAIDLSLVGKSTEALQHDYDWRDCALYALGVGATTSADLDYLFEMNGPKVLPTFACVPSFTALMDIVGKLKCDFSKILHGEQEIVLHKPIPSKGTFSTTATVEGIYDKGKGALVVVKAATVDKDAQPVFDNTFSVFVRGEGGFGGDRGPETIKRTPPERVADFTMEETTSPEQAALYRLNGDYNPLHISPKLATAVGFDKPILHGLCTYGFAGRAALKHACDGNLASFKRFGARFAGVVLPGDTLKTEGWKVSDTEYILSVSANGKPVLANAFLEIG